MSNNNPWISPIESEAEWQKKHLLLIFEHENAGPNWQYMNGLIRIACEHLGIAVTEVENNKN